MPEDWWSLLAGLASGNPSDHKRALASLAGLTGDALGWYTPNGQRGWTRSWQVDLPGTEGHAWPGDLGLRSGSLAVGMLASEPLEVPGPSIPGQPDALPRILVVPVRRTGNLAAVLLVQRVGMRPPFSSQEARGFQIAGKLLLEAMPGAFKAPFPWARNLSILARAFSLAQPVPHRAGNPLPLLVVARHLLGASSLVLLEGHGKECRIVARAGNVEWPPDGECRSPGWLEDVLLEWHPWSGIHEAFTVGGGLQGGLPEQARLIALRLRGIGRTYLVMDPGQAHPMSDGQGFLLDHLGTLCTLLHGRGPEWEARGRSEGNAHDTATLAEDRTTFFRQILHDLRNVIHAMGLAVEDAEMAAREPDRVRAATAVLDRHLRFIATYLREQAQVFGKGETPPGCSLSALLDGLATLGPGSGPVLPEDLAQTGQDHFTLALSPERLAAILDEVRKLIDGHRMPRTALEISVQPLGGLMLLRLALLGARYPSGDAAGPELVEGGIKARIVAHGGQVRVVRPTLSRLTIELTLPLREVASPNSPA